MKKVGEIMKEMGFNAESSEATQKAFIKYLLRVANRGKHVPERTSSEDDEWQELKLHSKNHKKPEEKQLSFAFIEKKSDTEAS